MDSTAAGIYGIRQLQRVRRGGLRKGPPRRTAVAGADGREGRGCAEYLCVVVGTKQSERAFGRARSGCFERLAGVFASRADGSGLQSWGELEFRVALNGLSYR